MPIYPEGFFETEEKYREFLEKKRLEDLAKLPTLTERVQSYLAGIKPPAEEVKLTWKEKIGLGLFNKVSDFFSIMWDKVFGSFKDALGGIVEDIFKFFIKELTTPHTARSKEKLKEMYERIGLPADRKLELYDQIEKGTPVDHFSAYIYAIIVELFGLTSTMSAAHDKGRQEQYKLLRPALPDLGSVLMARFRDPKFAETIVDYMSRMGLSDTAQEMLKVVSFLLLNPDEIKQLYLRGEISKKVKDERLFQVGIQQKDADDLEKLYYFIPSPADLVRFSVREAFDEQYITDYKLMLDYPRVFEEWAKKQGVSEYWAKKFWVSHWVLPSIGQGYEMLHRGEIKRPELESLFKALDIMPYWRDKLLAISYSLYTRVDVRRMYRAGVLSKQDVYDNYVGLGYDDEKAKKLTAFTVKDALESERDLTKTDILAGYQRRTFDKTQAIAFLLDLKYSKDEAGIFISRVDYDTAKKVKDKQLSWIKKNYIAKLITLEDARNRLAKLNLKGAETNELFSDWDIEKEGRMAELTFKQLQQLFIEDVLTEAEFIGRLEKKNYSGEDIQLLLKLTKKGVVEGE